jgi:hypothetical protein
LRFAISSPTLLRMSDDRQRGALLVAAALIASIRLRGEDIKPSPRLKAVVYDSVRLAVKLLREVQRTGLMPQDQPR